MIGLVKRRILAALRRNRRCSGEWLFRVAYRKRWAKRSALKAHIWQLRQMGFPIRGGSRTPAEYHMVGKQMKTPEGAVKAEIKEYLESLGDSIYYHMPVQQGYGTRTVDFLLCYKGMFIAIEAKRRGGYAKKFQLAILEAVRDAHGHAICADSVDQVKELFDYIDRKF